MSFWLQICFQFRKGIVAFIEGLLSRHPVKLIKKIPLPIPGIGMTRQFKVKGFGFGGKATKSKSHPIPTQKIVIPKESND